MNKTRMALALAAAFAAPAFAQQPTVEQKLQILQQEIDELKAQARGTPAVQQPSGASAPSDDSSGLDRSAGLASGGTGIVGYGEFNYNRFRQDDRETKADLRRFVFGLNHRFDDRLTFHSELEVEHAVVSRDDGGELEMEQAWLNYRLTDSDSVNVKAGLFLIPLGILNETHEPPTYYGVERNEVETRIIPSTWRELGVGLHGALAQGFRYDVGVTTGFDAGKIDDPTTGVRSGHQEGQNANAKDLSVYGALNYRRPGLLLGGGVFTGDTGQNGQSNELLKGVKARLTIWDVHAQYRVGGLDLQALYAAGKLGDAERINAANLGSAEPFAAPRSLKGAYAQAAYHVYKQGNFDVAPFVRVERFDIRQEEDPANGLLQDPNIQNERIRTIGVNFKVHPQVVLKADIQRYRNDKSRDRFDLGLGYMF
jgi:phosphate-selective porin O/P